MRDRMKFPIDSKCYPWMQEPSPDTGSARPVRLILDTDMGNDIDDALALAMIHTLQSRGECELLGVVVSKDNPWSAPFVDLVNRFYGRPAVPVGAVRNGVTPDDRTFIRQVCEARRPDGRPRYPRLLASNDAAPDAVTLLRRVLAAQPDQSVVVVMIGFATNFARLLDSPPDHLSPHSGMELMAKKVSWVCAMAANFRPEVLANPTRETREYNIHSDVASAQAFYHRCPVPVVFSGYEIGESIPFPASRIDEDFAWAEDHPVADAYRIYKPMPYDRPSWDQTAVLYAVRPHAGYFGISAPGRLRVTDDGCAGFLPNPQGLHRYLTLNREQIDDIREDIVRLCAEPVRGRLTWVG